MAGISLSDAEAKLTSYMAAEDKVLSGQSYTIDTGAGSRTLTRADLKEIRAGIEYWNAKCRALDTNRNRVRYLEPDTR